MASDDEYNSPGTATPAKTRKAACGIRFEEDELREGIDFSGAQGLIPDHTADADASPVQQYRKAQNQP